MNAFLPDEWSLWGSTTNHRTSAGKSCVGMPIRSSGSTLYLCARSTVAEYRHQCFFASSCRIKTSTSLKRGGRPEILQESCAHLHLLRSQSNVPAFPGRSRAHPYIYVVGETELLFSSDQNRFSAEKSCALPSLFKSYFFPLMHQQTFTSLP